MPQPEHSQGYAPVEHDDVSPPQPGPENDGPWYSLHAADSWHAGSKLAPV